MADKGQQTEQPTQRRLEKARREGQFPVSREFVGALQFAAFVTVALACGQAYFRNLVQAMRGLLRTAFASDLTVSQVIRMARDSSFAALLPIAELGGILVAVTAAAHLAITRGGFAGKKLAPDFKRLNFFARITEVPKQNAPLFVQALILLPLFGAVLYGVASENLQSFLRLPLLHLQPAVADVAGRIGELLKRFAGIFVVLGAFDLWRQTRKHAASLRMSKQEVREEAKETEGNPQIKSRIRRLQRDAARRRMMQEVPKATAVIVNPTHYAVAIRYRMEEMAAPSVVAKGKNYLALRIRHKATEHQVPIIENPPLAQALYKSTDVGQEIPPHLYKAVAEILAYIHKLMGGRLPG